MASKKSKGLRETYGKALVLRHGGGVKVMRDRRVRRQNRHSWKKDIECR